jgi:hypothetical protein
MCCVTSPEGVYMEKRDPISTLKHVSCWKNSLKILTQFSPGSTVLDAMASNTYWFIWKRACVSSPKLNSLIWNKISLCIP